MKIGSADERGEADEHGESEPSQVLEVFRFPEGVPVAFAEAGLHIRKSKRTVSGDWVAGEVIIHARRPCFSEELDDGTGLDAAYALVKGTMEIHLPKMLNAINELAQS